MIIGRMYDYHMLDMVELGVESYTALKEFKTAKVVGWDGNNGYKSDWPQLGVCEWVRGGWRERVAWILVGVQIGGAKRVGSIGSRPD